MPIRAQETNRGDGFGAAALLPHEQIELTNARRAQLAVSPISLQKAGAEIEILAGKGMSGIALKSLGIGLLSVSQPAEVFEDVPLQVVVFCFSGIQLNGVANLFHCIGELLLIDEGLSLREEGGCGAAKPIEGGVGALRIKFRTILFLDQPD